MRSNRVWVPKRDDIAGDASTRINVVVFSEPVPDAIEITLAKRFFATQLVMEPPVTSTSPTRIDAVTSPTNSKPTGFRLPKVRYHGKGLQGDDSRFLIGLTLVGCASTHLESQEIRSNTKNTDDLSVA